MHLEMLTKAGIRLMENIYMDEIVEKKVYEFCIFVAPLKIKGGDWFAYPLTRFDMTDKLSPRGPFSEVTAHSSQRDGPSSKNSRAK